MPIFPAALTNIGRAIDADAYKYSAMAVGMPLWMHPDESGARASARSPRAFPCGQADAQAGKRSSRAEEIRRQAPVGGRCARCFAHFRDRGRKVEALSRVNLQIAEGEFVSFIGPSGCGKTTLLRLIADLEQPTLGMLQVNGASAGEARLQRAYGYIFQAPALYPWRTIEKNVMLPLGAHYRRHRLQFR
jgi:ABC-type glutathione transport system ATPase component